MHIQTISGSLRESLRIETRELHAELESRMALLDRPLTPQGYIDVLLQLHNALSSMVEAWHRSEVEIPWSPDFSDRLRWLEADLRELGQKPAGNTTAWKGPSDSLGWWGSFYVYEGSSLGGQFIARALHDSFPNSLNYFSGYGAATGIRWRNFLMEMENNVRPSEYKDVVAGARLSFQLFLDQAEGKKRAS
ncbi:MAG: hypothetical protein C5B49_16310 [Bdellovibrio sp.]|nr:MAG: hypothetical protein C5B49_16310 [Bdellovibrio sp.]